MTAENALALYELISATANIDLKRDLEEAALAYAHCRARCLLASREERESMNAARSAAHETLIDACNILARAMSRSDENSAWRAVLGDDRKVVGDFACQLHCLLALRAR